MTLLHGDCLDRLKELADNSVDAVVTDPPYGLKFMGKKWDYDVPSVAIWTEVLRVLKPGGHVLSFGGTRTYHRMVINIEDAGFEIRDQVQWIYGSGFPKSHDVSKGIDKAAGAKRVQKGNARSGSSSRAFQSEEKTTAGVYAVTPDAVTPDAVTWQGWGTALKPANEPIVLARKPLSEKTVSKNVLKWGCGALNIDAGRIEAADQAVLDAAVKRMTGNTPKGWKQTSAIAIPKSAQGRWPANVIFDEDAANILGEPSRFFYVAKASKRERNAGLEGLEVHRFKSGIGQGKDPKAPTIDKNHHPTVKPIKLMEYLIKTITPPNGVVLDPFMGSGSTGVACKNLGFEFIGVELNAEYIEIAKRRIG